jgi:nucleoid-associated protein YgaU
MALKNPNKLEKLTITAYQDDKRKSKVGQPFEAMFNPESFSQKYSITYGKNIGNNAASEKVNYARSKPSVLTLKLLLDGTGSHEIQSTSGATKPVASRVNDLLNLTYRVNGKIHEPNYLTVSWGEYKFSCRLSNLDINYTSFNPDGTPLRAELNLELLSDTEVKKQLASNKLSSPDLTHSRIVKSGDTLPMLSKEIYGSTSHYLWLAQQNQLDDFRNLTPGQRLFFPPLVS